MKEKLKIYKNEGILSGLLFHGTAEEIKGSLKVGGYDEVFWTTDTPSIAQTYIPSSGMEMLYPHLTEYEKKQKVIPSKRGFWFPLVVDAMGYDINHPDIIWDEHGFEVKSWPSIYPTYEECIKFLKTKGYDEETKWIKTKFIGNKEIILENNHKDIGTVFVVENDGLNILDMRRGEADLTNVEYHDLEGFQKARKAGYDGILINDFAQTNLGNFIHTSIGLFQETIDRLNFSSYRASNFEIPENNPWIKTTPEFEDFVDEEMRMELRL